MIYMLFVSLYAEHLERRWEYLHEQIVYECQHAGSPNP